jgi:hypothetical protein
MKKFSVVLMITMLVFCLGAIGRAKPALNRAPEQEKAQTQETAPVAQAIAASFEEAVNSIAGGDFVGGISLLLDITLLTGPEESLPEGFKDKIVQAKSEFAVNDLAAGGRNVREALKIWNPDAEVELTTGDESEAENPAPLARIFKGKIMSARDLMVEGDVKSAVTTILQALLMLSPAQD